jgi:hypothetical protein
MRGLCELVPMTDIFVSGLGKIEKLAGGCLRIYLYVDQAPIEGDGPVEKQVVAKIIVPASALPDAVLMLAQAAQEGGDGGVVTARAGDVVH